MALVDDALSSWPPRLSSPVPRPATMRRG